jgi:uncharacterized Fe-S cluster-containing radical SAM superfamily protein
MAVRQTQSDKDQVADKGPRDTMGRPVRDLRISVLDRCNLRCPYCMPESQYHADYQFLKKQELLSHEEIQRIASIAVGLGVTKLRLTGGEPLLDKTIPDLIARLGKLPNVDDFALTTNGMLLPPIAQKLADAGLHRVTISLDSLDEETFQRMSGNRGDVAKVLQGIEAAEEAGLTPIKINVVVQRGVNDHQIPDLLDHFRGSGHTVRSSRPGSSTSEYRNAGHCGPLTGNIPERSRAVTAISMVREKSALFLQSRSRSVVPATARVCRQTASSIPACSRPQAPAFGSRFETAPTMPSWPIFCPGSGCGVTTATASCANPRPMSNRC